MANLILDTTINNGVILNLKNSNISINQSEFWYFNYMLEEVSLFFKSSENKSKIISLKIPGTGRFEKLNYSDFNNIYNQVKSKVAHYQKEYSIANSI